MPRATYNEPGGSVGKLHTYNLGILYSIFILTTMTKNDLRLILESFYCQSLIGESLGLETEVYETLGLVLAMC